MTFEPTYEVDDKGREYCSTKGAVTPTEIYGFMRLSDASYIDHNGVEHDEPTPEGFLKTDNIAWRANKGYVQEMVSKLADDGCYCVFIYEPEANR